MKILNAFLFLFACMPEGNSLKTSDLEIGNTHGSKGDILPHFLTQNVWNAEHGQSRESGSIVRSPLEKHQGSIDVTFRFPKSPPDKHFFDASINKAEYEEKNRNNDDTLQKGCGQFGPNMQKLQLSFFEDVMKKLNHSTQFSQTKEDDETADISFFLCPTLNDNIRGIAAFPSQNQSYVFIVDEVFQKSSLAFSKYMETLPANESGGKSLFESVLEANKTADSKTKYGLITNMIADIIKDLVYHESGHSLGLKHSFNVLLNKTHEANCDQDQSMMGYDIFRRLGNLYQYLETNDTNLIDHDAFGGIGKIDSLALKFAYENGPDATLEDLYEARCNVFKRITLEDYITKRPSTAQATQPPSDLETPIPSALPTSKSTSNPTQTNIITPLEDYITKRPSTAQITQTPSDLKTPIPSALPTSESTVPIISNPTQTNIISENPLLASALTFLVVSSVCYLLQRMNMQREQTNSVPDHDIEMQLLPSGTPHNPHIESQSRESQSRETNSQ